MTLTNLTGKTFGLLFVIKEAARRGKYRRYWLCKCECGTCHEVRDDCLRTGGTTSCGCTRINNVIAANRKHGACETAEYTAWEGMHTRCRSQKYRAYSRYGGRGIRVCDRWSGDKGAENFLNDMGPRPSPKHSLDRIDNDGNYEPGNCRWATLIEQHGNKSSNHLLTHNGLTLPLAEWARRSHIKADTLHARICDYGWTVKRALETKVTKH